MDKIEPITRVPKMLVQEHQAGVFRIVCTTILHWWSPFGSVKASDLACIGFS
jgi:hypothetical protein